MCRLYRKEGEQIVFQETMILYTQYEQKPSLLRGSIDPFNCKRATDAPMRHQNSTAENKEPYTFGIRECYVRVQASGISNRPPILFRI